MCSNLRNQSLFFSGAGEERGSLYVTVFLEQKLSVLVTSQELITGIGLKKSCIEHPWMHLA